MSISLLTHLAHISIWATGTIRMNHLEDCPLQKDTTLEKADCGSTRYFLDTTENIVVAAWRDNKTVTLAFNCAGVEPKGSVSRWCRQKAQRISISLVRQTSFMPKCTIVTGEVLTELTKMCCCIGLHFIRRSGDGHSSRTLSTWWYIMPGLHTRKGHSACSASGETLSVSTWCDTVNQQNQVVQGDRNHSVNEYQWMSSSINSHFFADSETQWRCMHCGKKH